MPSNDAVSAGVAVPPHNPTVAAEFDALCPASIELHYAPMASTSDDSRERLLGYGQAMIDVAAGMRAGSPQAFGFACTGTSYLLGADEEQARVEAAERAVRAPVITATQAIRQELLNRGATRIALVAPYPDYLCDAAEMYWSSLGVTVAATHRIAIGEDTRAIYAIEPATVDAAISAVDLDAVDLVLLSGTGMPTLATLAATTSPMLSSNLCLLTEVLRRCRQWPAAEPANLHQLMDIKGRS